MTSGHIKGYAIEAVVSPCLVGTGTQGRLQTEVPESHKGKQSQSQEILALELAGLCDDCFVLERVQRGK